MKLFKMATIVATMVTLSACNSTSDNKLTKDNNVASVLSSLTDSTSIVDKLMMLPLTSVASEANNMPLDTLKKVASEFTKRITSEQGKVTDLTSSLKNLNWSDMTTKGGEIKEQISSAKTNLMNYQDRLSIITQLLNVAGIK